MYYTYSNQNVSRYLNKIYEDGLQRSNHLSDVEIESIILSIGIFKFKGYYYAFKSSVTDYSIDDVLVVYFFDKYLTRIVFDLTSSIETKLKTILVELCYKQIKDLPRNHPQKNNPFFYLIRENYIVGDFRLNYSSEGSWRSNTDSDNTAEPYTHYNYYYKNKYDFQVNKTRYLSDMELIEINGNINYPPFHFFVESITLGTLIYIIEKLELFGRYNVLNKVANKFYLTNTRINFSAYLKRLKEIRNRAAHRERVFNRSYRSIVGISHYNILRNISSTHKFIDVYMFLFLMLEKLNHESYDDFIKDEIERLFNAFQKDYYINNDSKNLVENISQEEFEKVKEFIMNGMGV